MSLLKSAVRVARDLKHFGPGFQRHLFMAKSDDVVELPVRGLGTVFVRLAESDIETFRQVFASREYALGHPPALAARVRARYDSIVASGRVPVIVDAGANIGAATLFFSREFPKAHTVAVEPDNANFAVLSKNLEGRANCLPLHAAIGAEPGFVSVVSGDADGLGWAKQTTRSEAGVPIVTIEDAMQRVPNGQPFLAKVDIEGFESDLFASNLGWLDHVEAVYIEPHDWMKPGERTSANFQKAMAERPFEVFIRGENLIYARA